MILSSASRKEDERFINASEDGTSIRLTPPLDLRSMAVLLV